ncbi:hypothetical protein M2189_001695 [Bradyrhizobium japonicum]|uniref:hypothetical protein n=1 Tax=Bradyrhizobium japonicum TaxID=375 RepID=UPI00216A9EB1|nr:hypothetical protein [Bradyrhizobium japonicum]MCS3499344.1 hypothetical protein [Bradyrhizobium japonicum]MCS3958492.1 hypothetical protein [Bradyrhizobium japonicum]MCS4000246.1 hypothetical protein [Bradyrhizobium japonicum]
MNMMHKPERCCHGHEAETCTQCRTGSRNRYYRRKMMTAEDFRAEQDYMIGRRRLVNRAMYGWGVVEGLCVAHDGTHANGHRLAQDQADVAKSGRLVIGHGFALDGHGRELLVPEDHCLGSHDFFVVDAAANHCRPQDPSTLKAGRYLLSAHYAEQRIDPVRLSDACDGFEQEWNRICETVVYSLTPIQACPPSEAGCPHDCGCLPSPQKPPRQDADPNTHAPAERADEAEHMQHPPRDQSWPRSHHVLCCWSDHAEIAGAGTVCHWRDDIWIDACAGVPLACVDFTRLECCEPVFGEISKCTPRRIVKRNDLLFDLIRGCDLTRIKALTWAPWHGREIDWDTFHGKFYHHASPEWPHGAETELEIEFSGPVQTRTITADAVTFTVVLRDSGTAWNEMYRAPILGFKFEAPHQGDPAGTTRKASIIVRRSWYNDEIRFSDSDHPSKFNVDVGKRDRYPVVEIEIHGDLILDCRGVPIDGNSAGPGIVPTGNGAPGGTCRAVFRVAPSTASDAPR